MSTNFRERLRNHERLLGTIVTLTDSAVAEMLNDLGFDWLFIDGEHAPFTLADLKPIFQASTNAASIVRIPELSEGTIKQTLDLGADGLIIPQIKTAQETERIIQYARYAPEGARGVGIGRAHGYGMRFQQYMDEANHRISIIVQAEHIEAVRNIDAIVNVPGVDAILIGPYDLAASMGKMGQVDDPEVTQAIDSVAEACSKVEMPVGIFGVTTDAIRPYVKKGYSLLVVGVDTILLGQAAKSIIDSQRDA